ncbi:MAG: 4Fe-4S double cluster binding domain-containing protein [Thermodesulfovibrionales bacterium]
MGIKTPALSTFRYNNLMDASAELKAFCKSSGADLAGIADLAPFQQGWPTLPADLLRSYTRAVSVAVRLSDDIMDAIGGHPTIEYADHYRKVNEILDNLTADIVAWIMNRGFRAEAVPASKIMDTENLLGGLSHKAVARMAGIGWQGKSLLIVSPEFGPRIRLATVLTDMPLTPDNPVKNRCGACTECTDACPAGAIRNATASGMYASREEALFFGRCVDKTLAFSKMPGISARICGVCVRACPHGKSRKAAEKE